MDLNTAKLQLAV